MAEKMKSADSWNEMIFGYIRVKKDWLSAHILKNRLEHESDHAQREVEANEATDLKVRKKKYLDKRVKTHENPLFDAWCTEGMGTSSSGTEVPEEKLVGKEKRRRIIQPCHGWMAMEAFTLVTKTSHSK